MSLAFVSSAKVHKRQRFPPEPVLWITSLPGEDGEALCKFHLGVAPCESIGCKFGAFGEAPCGLCLKCWVVGQLEEGELQRLRILRCGCLFGGM